MSDLDGQAGTQSGTGEDGAQSGTNPPGNDGTTGTGTQSGTQTGSQQTGQQASGESVSRAEFDRLKQHLSQADQRREAAEKALREIKDKDLPELERFKRDVAEAQDRVKTLEADLAEQRIANAFLSDNTYSWHNPAHALSSVDRDLITIDEKGNVTGLKAALEKVAKTYPYMVKPKDGVEADDKGGPTGPAGTPPMNAGGNGTGRTQPSKLAQRFPAMRTRPGGTA